MTWRALLALLAAWFAALALAQEAPQDASPAPAPTPAPAAEPAPAAAARPAPRGGASDERFVPSEDISEDLSVSFPSDI
jgi:nucleoid-associated protein YgaU